MTKTRTMLMMLAAVTGCGVGGGGGGRDDQGHDPDQPLFEGSYALESTVRLPDGYLAGSAPLLDEFIAMSDDPHDPATWLLDRIEDRLSWPQDDAFALAREVAGLDEALNQLILDHSPELVVELAQLGGDMAELAHNLQISSRLVVADGIAEHEVVAIAFAIDGAVAPIEGIALPAARGIAVQVDGDTVRIDRHGLALEQGALLRIALEDVALPRVAPGAGSVTEWLAGELDCAGIGEAIEEVVEVGSPSDYRDICIDLIDRGVEEILGSALEMRARLMVDGRGQLADEDGDQVLTGTWNGTMQIDGGQSLAMPVARFEGVLE
jgi:hypothetical protein